MEEPNLDAELRERLRRLVIRFRGGPVTVAELHAALGPRKVTSDIMEDIHVFLHELGVEIVAD